MEPQIRFSTSLDGTRIAFSTRGEGPPLVNFPAWGSNIEIEASHPTYRQWEDRLSHGRQFVQIDRRGCASSQRDADDFSLDAHIGDLASVVDQLELPEFDLCGSGDGAAVCIAYAAQNPERVSHLVLWSTSVSAAENTDLSARRATLALIRDNWSLARRAMADSIYPNGPTEVQRWWADLLKQSMSSEVTAEYFEFQASVDVEPYLPQVEAPTLVMHPRSRAFPISAARGVAAQMPTSTFVPIDSDNTNVVFADLSYLDTVRAFIDDAPTDVGGRRTIETGTFRTVLFTDIVGHTEMMSRLGDERGGSEVKTMGDGFMASFGSVTKAVECAIGLQRAFAERESDEPLSLRVGINAGEPIEEDGDLFGATVILASRIAAKAEGGEILVADTIRGLCSGKAFHFADRGEFVAKGFEDPVRLFEVSWREGD